MSKKKASLKDLSPSEMAVKTRELNEQLFKLRLQKSTGQLTNTALFKTTRKGLAHLNTYKNQIELKG